MANYKYKDLSGEVFGRLCVLRREGKNKHNHALWRVQCSCGSTPLISGLSLRSGNTRSCGCLNLEAIRYRALELTKDIPLGTMFGNLKVVGRAEVNKQGTAKWLVECRCGGKSVRAVLGSSLRNGHSTSCGCTRRKRRKDYPSGWLGNKVRITYKQGAAKRGLSWELSDEEFYRLIATNCFYCNQPPTNCVRAKIFPQSRKYDMPDFFYSGIDRVDNTKGYMADNVVSCCKICNAMKEKLTQTEFLQHIHRVFIFQEAKGNQLG